VGLLHERRAPQQHLGQAASHADAPRAGRDAHSLCAHSSLHLSSATLGKDVQNELVDILKSDTCPLRLLDVSNTAFDGAALARALEVNSSLRSLDVRHVTGMADSLENIGSILLKPESKSNLAYFRSDAFQVLEGETVISLRERPMVKGAMLVLSGLLRRNRDVQELDLAATGLRLDWVVALIEVLANNLQSASPRSICHSTPSSRAGRRRWSAPPRRAV